MISCKKTHSVGETNKKGVVVGLLLDERIKEQGKKKAWVLGKRPV